MAKFIKEPVNVKCGFCGRHDQELCRILYGNPNSKRVHHSRRISICKECGKLIWKVASAEEKPTERTRHRQKNLPAKIPARYIEG